MFCFTSSLPILTRWHLVFKSFQLLNYFICNNCPPDSKCNYWCFFFLILIVFLYWCTSFVSSSVLLTIIKSVFIEMNKVIYSIFYIFRFTPRQTTFYISSRYFSRLRRDILSVCSPAGPNSKHWAAVSEQPLKMIRSSMAEIFGPNAKYRLTRWKPEDLEQSIDSGWEILTMKKVICCKNGFVKKSNF